MTWLVLGKHYGRVYESRLTALVAYNELRAFEGAALFSVDGRGNRTLVAAGRSDRRDAKPPSPREPMSLREQVRADAWEAALQGRWRPR